MTSKLVINNCNSSLTRALASKDAKYYETAVIFFFLDSNKLPGEKQGYGDKISNPRTKSPYLPRELIRLNKELRKYLRIDVHY